MADAASIQHPASRSRQPSEAGKVPGERDRGRATPKPSCHPCVVNIKKYSVLVMQGLDGTELEGHACSLSVQWFVLTS